MIYLINFDYLSEGLVNLPIVSRLILSGTYSNKIPFVGQDTTTEIFLTDFDYTDRIKQLLDTSFNKYLNQNIISSTYPVKTLTTLKKPTKPVIDPQIIKPNIDKPSNNKPLNNKPLNNKSVKSKATSEVKPENIQVIKTKKNITNINATKYGWAIDYSKFDSKIMEGACVSHPYSS